MNTIQEEQTASPEIEEPPVDYDNMKIESMVFVAPPRLEEPAKKRTRQNSEYMREYYHKHKTETVCCFLFYILHVQEQSS